MTFKRLSGCKISFAAALFTAVIAASGATAQNTVHPIVLSRGAPSAAASSSKPTLAAVPDSRGASVSFSPRPRPVAAASTEKGTAGASAPAATMSRAAAPAAAPFTPSLAVTGNPTLDADFNTPLRNEKTVHLAVGHSLFIDTKHRLSRVYITNPEVLNSYTSSPNEVVVTAKQSGASNFILWDEMGDTQVYMVSAGENLDGLNSALKKTFPNEHVEVNDSGGRITLSGTVGTQTTADAIGKLAALYGKDVANTLFVSSSRVKQVRLKVRFAEVDRSRLSQFGFNLFAILNGSGSNPTLAQSTTGQFASTFSTASTGSSAGAANMVGGQTVSVSNPLNFVLYNASHNIGATIQDLEDKQIMHILAEPTIAAMSGQKANFLAGGEFPFPVVQGGGTAGTTASITVQFRPYGVKLDFTPLVNADGTIDLTVAPEVSALDYSNAVTISGYTIPALSTRRAQTEVVLRNGQSFAVSGLLDQRTTDALGRTPGIASVPILGALFRSKNINHSISELIVIVTPEIVDPLNDQAEENKLPTSPIPLLSPQKFDQAFPAKPKNTGGAK